MISRKGVVYQKIKSLKIINNHQSIINNITFWVTFIFITIHVHFLKSMNNLVNFLSLSSSKYPMKIVVQNLRSPFLSPIILFELLLYNVSILKKVIFLSSSCTHKIIDFCIQCYSSYANLLQYYARTSFSLLSISTSLLFHRIFYSISSSSSFNACFLCSTFLNFIFFQCFNIILTSPRFLDSLYIVVPWILSSHHFVRFFFKLGCSIYMNSNLKGVFLFSFMFIFIFRGQS